MNVFPSSIPTILAWSPAYKADSVVVVEGVVDANVAVAQDVVVEMVAVHLTMVAFYLQQ